MLAGTGRYIYIRVSCLLAFVARCRRQRQTNPGRDACQHTHTHTQRHRYKPNKRTYQALRQYNGHSSSREYQPLYSTCRIRFTSVTTRMNSVFLSSSPLSFSSILLTSLHSRCFNRVDECLHRRVSVLSKSKTVTVR